MSPVRHAPAELTAGDTALRARYLHEVLGVLYPGTDVIAGADATAVAEYLVIPDAKRPRLLVPAHDRQIAAAAVRHYAVPTSRTARMKRDAVVAALRTGASGLLLRDRVAIVAARGGRNGSDTIDDYLTRVLGSDVAISVHIGPARANRKPVLQLLSPDGETIGFAKLGTNALTRTLVRAETEALTRLNQVGVTHLAIPRVLHAGEWCGHEVLVQSALPIWRPRASLAIRRLNAAIHEVSRVLGTHTDALAGDEYWRRLRQRLGTLTEPGAVTARPEAAAEAETLAQAADVLVSTAGHLPMRFGSWHGDWSPWNMATLADTLLVWDWERFTTGVPLGYDALHYDLQRLLDRGTAPDRAVDTTTGRAARLLEPYGVDIEIAHVTALLYLVELATRYLEDRQAESGARLGVLGNWLLPVLTAKVSDL